MHLSRRNSSFWRNLEWWEFSAPQTSLQSHPWATVILCSIRLWMRTGLPLIPIILSHLWAAKFCTGTWKLWGRPFSSPIRISSFKSIFFSSPVEISTVAGEIVQKTRFHPTLENYLAVLGSPGPVASVWRSLGPALITEPLLVRYVFIIYCLYYFEHFFF